MLRAKKTKPQKSIAEPSRKKPDFESFAIWLLKTIKNCEPAELAERERLL